MRILALALPLSLAAQPAPLDVRQFYQKHCVTCHGVDGSARSADGKRLRGRDFTSSKEMKGETDERLAQAIRRGIFFGKVMPAFKDALTKEDALRLVREVIRKAEKGKVIAPQPESAQPSAGSGVKE